MTSFFSIDSYSFGVMKINGSIYTADLIITPDRIIADWWRREGHCFFPEDLAGIDLETVESVFIGTGWDGLLKVDQATVELFDEKNISFLVDKTAIAVREYNRCTSSNKVGFFHLTC